MLRKINTYKKSVIAVFLMALLSVYVCQILCDLDIYSMKRITIAATADISDHHGSHSGADHHHDSEKSHDHHDHDQTSKEAEGHTTQHSGQEDDCCEDMTTKVFESLFAQKINLPSLEAKLFFVFELEFSTFQAFYNSIFTDSYNYYSDSSPPINGSDIVVFVQSFLL